MTPQTGLYKATAEPSYSFFKIVRMDNQDYAVVDLLNCVSENVIKDGFRSN
jgi:hypothetical protein